jgi:steroid delta-isomerase-like uncharacterized protein
MALSAPTALETTQQLAKAYGDAWNAHDLEAIMAMHAPDAVFHLHLEGFEEAATPEAIRAQFAFFFAAFPDLHFATERLTVREDLFVHEFTITGTLAQPFPIAGLVAEPTGERIAFAGVDVIPCARGAVLRKDTYLDSVAFQRGLGLGAG